MHRRFALILFWADLHICGERKNIILLLFNFIGQFQKDAKQDHCDPCHLGEYGNEIAATRCYICDKGYFTNVTGMRFCYPCERGKYGISIRASECLNCHAGTASNKIAFVPGIEETCPHCIAGYFSANIGETACTACVPGRFNHNKGNQHCTPCAAGHASDRIAFNGTSCEPCLAGAGNVS